MKMEQTQCSETSAYKLQTLGNYLKESIQHTEHGESLKSRNVLCFKCQEPLVQYYAVSCVILTKKNLVQKTHFLKQFLPLMYYISFFHMRWSFLSLCTCILCRSSSNPDMHTIGDEDDEVNKLARGLDRTSSMRAGTINVIFSFVCMDLHPK